VSAVGLTGDQIQQIEQIEERIGNGLRQARIGERRAYLRFLRSMRQDPLDEDQVAERQRIFEERQAERMRLVSDRVRSTRLVMTAEQWKVLWREAPQALQIGPFKPVGGGDAVYIDDQEPPAKSR